MLHTGVAGIIFTSPIALSLNLSIFSAAENQGLTNTWCENITSTSDKYKDRFE